MSDKVKSRLMIAGSPGRGSLVFDLMPESSPADEVGDGPQGAVSMFREPSDDDQQIDHAVVEAITLLTRGNDLSPELTGSDFIAGIVELGPRTAACMRDFTRSVHRSQFDVDVEWRQPQRATARVHLGAGKADLIARAIELSESDTEPVIIEGRVLTVSTVQSQQWLIEPTDGDLVVVAGVDDHDVGIADQGVVFGVMGDEVGGDDLELGQDFAVLVLAPGIDEELAGLVTGGIEHGFWGVGIG